KLLYPIVNARQVYLKNILAFTQIGFLQNLLTLQSAVSLQFNCLELIIRILEEEASHGFSHSCADRREQHDDQNHSGEHAHGSSNAMPRHSRRPALHVKQVLLPPLTHIGYSPIARPGAFLAKTHLRFPSVLARESAIMRAQRST